LARIDWEIGIYPEMFETAMKWYGLAFKERKPGKEDQRILHVFEWLIADMYRQDKEEREENKND